MGVGVPDLDLSVPICPFADFPDFLGGDFADLFGDFPICRVPLSRPVKGAYTEHSRKGPQQNQDLPEKSGQPLGLETPPSGAQNNAACVRGSKR